MLKRIFAAILCLIPLFAQAQDHPRTILVLDASGSMWGQIDGKAKITIAQDVIGKLLSTLPEDQELGLTVYGHRRKGDCSDIETVIQPGTGTRDAIAAAVNAIKPKGKTPLSAAVLQAAEALKYTEEKATVILISDGRETCQMDPCAVGRKLEESGVDFTADVIGFDVSKPQDKAELKCLADATGGTFLTASNAEELTQALQKVAEPEPSKIGFRVVEKGGKFLDGQFIWSLTYNGKSLKDMEPGKDGFLMELLPGSGHVEVLRPEDEATAAADFTVKGGDQKVVLELPKLLPSASIDAPDEAPAGSEITVNWTGPNKSSDVIALANPKDGAAEGVANVNIYFYVDQNANNTAQMRLPTTPGIYELRYQTSTGNGDILARKTIKVTDFQFEITAPDQVPVGTAFNVEWKSPTNKGYIISLANPGDSSNDHIVYLYADQYPDTKATMTAPTKPGTYEVRIQDGVVHANILARHTIKVSEIKASLSAPDQVEVGETFKVVWDGPNKKISGGGDYIAVSKPGSKANDEITYAYTKDSENNTAKLIAPIRPGIYELRYILNGNGNRVLASQKLEVLPVAASVDFDNPAQAGETLAVKWTGPARQNSGGGDYISISKPGSKGNDEITYAYVKDSDGDVVNIKVPTTPGTYELRYILNGSDNIILAAKELQVEPVSATLKFDSPAPAGSTLKVTWDGPGGDDYIAIAQPGMKVSEEVTYAYVRDSDGNTLAIKTPTTPGTYELRYVQKGNEKKILAAETLQVEPVSATLKFDNPAPAGGKLPVTWDGPGGDDYIAIAQPGMKVSEEVTYAYVRDSDGNTLEIDIPTATGSYELRYVQKGNEKKILAARPLDVVPMTATLQASETATPGDKLQVTWSGPTHPRDTIIIAKPGSDSAESFASVAGGSPATLYVPVVKGDYEIRYIYGPLNKVLATIPLKVE